MSPILPISFVVTLLCVLVAINWPLYQQILFVGAALTCVKPEQAVKAMEARPSTGSR